MATSLHARKDSRKDEPTTERISGTLQTGNNILLIRFKNMMKMHKTLPLQWNFTVQENYFSCFNFQLQAAMHLHEDYAKYPRKITYIYSPPHLACEALEVNTSKVTLYNACTSTDAHIIRILKS